MTSATVWNNQATPRLSANAVVHKRAQNLRSPTGVSLDMAKGPAQDYVNTPCGPVGFRTDPTRHLGLFQPNMAHINSLLIQGGAANPPDTASDRYYPI